METKKQHSRKGITNCTNHERKTIRQMAMEGKSREEIAHLTGRSYPTISRILRGKHKRKNAKVKDAPITRTEDNFFKGKDYKKLYHKALAMLIEAGLLDVDLED